MGQNLAPMPPAMITQKLCLDFAISPGIKFLQTYKVNSDVKGQCIKDKKEQYAKLKNSMPGALQ